MVQFLLPCALELHYSLSVLARAASQAVPTSSNQAGSARTTTTATRGAWDVIGCWGAVTAALVIMVTSLRSILLTCMFFHTVAENAVGFVIAAAVYCVPLYFPAVANMWLAVAKQD
jgi:hypothetical protein